MRLQTNRTSAVSIEACVGQCELAVCVWPAWAKELEVGLLTASLLLVLAEPCGGAAFVEGCSFATADGRDEELGERAIYIETLMRLTSRLNLLMRFRSQP